MSAPSVFPTSTTIFNPEKTWSGYTVFEAFQTGSAVVDMNGNVVRLWKNLQGFPVKMLPGGFVLASLGVRNPNFGLMDHTDLVQVDWEGNVVWRFNQYEFIEDPGEEGMWMARMHHDFQREGNPVGYYVPGMEPKVDGGNTLILGHKEITNPSISDKPLLDDVIYEINWEGDILWEWVCSDHFEELNFSEAARNAMYRDPTMVIGDGKLGDWMHMNSASTLGPNRWHDNGDSRFHPDNIVWSGRQTNIIAITEKSSGKIVWQIGPDYDCSEALRKMGWIIGQHHAHMIPQGLPGEGNILVFDNGGVAGYGNPNPGAATGHNNAIRDYSRVIEFDPVTLERIWQYSYIEANHIPRMSTFKFYSSMISSAQRLPNGNTMITEGVGGRIFEVTPEHEIVWEYVSPYFGPHNIANQVYRAYRVPYDWIPQVEKPEEVAIVPVDNSRFRAPGAEWNPEQSVIEVAGTTGYKKPQFCITEFEKPLHRTLDSSNKF